MDAIWKNSLWSQFGAAIDMLDNAVVACPASSWGEHTGSAFWYVAYHTLFWLDLYLTGAVAGFAPPAPFALEELDPTGLLPPRVYAKEELRAYLAHCRQKCWAIIDALTPEQTARRCQFSWGEVSFAELLLYNMRHVQEHASQLALMLGQTTAATPGWITKAKPLNPAH